MKLNIIAGLLFALLLTAGMGTKANAQCCRWHSYHYSCCNHMDSKDNDNDDKDKKEDVADKDKTKDKDCCHAQHCCGYHYWGCHSWCYVAPKHTECCHHHVTCHHECYHHHCDDCCSYGYYYRGGGH